MNKGFISNLKNDKRLLVIAFIVVALVISVFTKAYVSASDVDENMPEQVADVPELVVSAGEEVTLQDSINAAEAAQPQQAAGDPGDVAAAPPVVQDDAPAADKNAETTIADTPVDSEGSKSANADQPATDDGSESNPSGVVPPVTDSPETTPPTITDQLTDPVVTGAPDVQPGEAPLQNDGVELPGDNLSPIDKDAPILVEPDLVLIDPGTELTPAEAAEPIVQDIKPSKEQEKKDLDNETGISSDAVFPEGYTAKGDKNTIRLTYDEILQMMEGFPEGTTVERQMVVLKAYALVGKVNYFWGGKSEELTWDARWGNPARVTSGGSKTSGTVRSFGLDCSGYVTWVFNNSAGQVVSNVIGHGSSNQWFKSDPINSIEEVLPGDLAFFAVPGTRRINHVGVVIGMDEEGKLLVAHCSSSRNNVVITEFRASGFKYLRRPHVYNDENYMQSAREMMLQEDIGYAYCWLRSEESSWEQAEVGDLVFKQSQEEDGSELLETGVIRRIDEDGKMWVSKMPYNASSDMFDATEAGFQTVRRPTGEDIGMVMKKQDEDKSFNENDFVVMQP